MFLGTSRIWWIAAAAALLLGLALLGTGMGGTLGTAAGILLMLLAIGLYAAAPMRYGRDKRPPPPVASSPPEPPLPPQPRPEIEARDARDV